MLKYKKKYQRAEWKNKYNLSTIYGFKVNNIYLTTKKKSYNYIARIEKSMQTSL